MENYQNSNGQFGGWEQNRVPYGAQYSQGFAPSQGLAFFNSCVTIHLLWVSGHSFIGYYADKQYYQDR